MCKGGCQANAQSGQTSEHQRSWQLATRDPYHRSRIQADNPLNQHLGDGNELFSEVTLRRGVSRSQRNSTRRTEEKSRSERERKGRLAPRDKLSIERHGLHTVRCASEHPRPIVLLLHHVPRPPTIANNRDTDLKANKLSIMNQFRIVSLKVISKGFIASVSFFRSSQKIEKNSQKKIQKETPTVFALLDSQAPTGW